MEFPCLWWRSARTCFVIGLYSSGLAFYRASVWTPRPLPVATFCLGMAGYVRRLTDRAIWGGAPISCRSPACSSSIRRIAIPPRRSSYSSHSDCGIRTVPACGHTPDSSLNARRGSPCGCAGKGRGSWPFLPDALAGAFGADQISSKAPACGFYRRRKTATTLPAMAQSVVMMGSIVEFSGCRRMWSGSL